MKAPHADDQAKVALEEPDQALMGYLQALLDEIPAEPVPEPAVAPPATVAQTRMQIPEPVPEATPPAPAEKTRPVVAEPPRAEREPVLAVADRVETVPSPAEVLSEAAVDTVPAVGPDIPGWARVPFQVLCFTADGLQFGLPLLALRGIVRLEGGLTQLPGTPSWHRGLLLARGEKVGVVDLARLLRPGAAGLQLPARGYVLLLDGGSWGLACESLGSARRLEPDAVRWRRAGSRVPLIRGVIRDGLTPLLAADEILERLGA